MTNNNAWFEVRGDEEIERLLYIADRHGCDLVLAGFERQQDPQGESVQSFKCKEHKTNECPTELDYDRS